MNDPPNYKLGVIVDLDSTKATNEISSGAYPGSVAIQGKITNIGTNTHKDIFMTLILYDASNHTISSDPGNPNLTTLAPGDNSPFFALVDGKGNTDMVSNIKDIYIYSTKLRLPKTNLPFYHTIDSFSYDYNNVVDMVVKCWRS
jgi:hypothetical protein